MSIRQELLKQAEQKLGTLLEQCGEAVVKITGEGDISVKICRILSTVRNESLRTQVIRDFANEREAELIAGWNEQPDLPLNNDEKDDL